MGNILKKVDGDWKKSCLEAPSANAKQRIIMQIELYTVFILIMQWSTAYTVACINGTDNDYVMDSGNGLSRNDWSK